MNMMCNRLTFGQWAVASRGPQGRLGEAGPIFYQKVQKVDIFKLEITNCPLICDKKVQMFGLRPSKEIRSDFINFGPFWCIHGLFCIKCTKRLQLMTLKNFVVH